MTPERTTLLPSLLLGLFRMHLDATDEELSGLGATREDVLALIRQHDVELAVQETQRELAELVVKSAARRK